MNEQKTTKIKMKKLIYFSLAALLLSCGGNKESEKEAGEKTLSGKIKDGAGKTIYLEGFTMEGTFKIDSAVIGKDGSYEVTVPAKTDFYRLGFDNANYILLSIDSTDGNVTLNAKADTLSIGYTVDGSQYSKDILEFVNEQTPYTIRRLNLITVLNATDPNDTATLRSSQEAMMKMDRSFNEFAVNFVNKHPKSPATFLALAFLDPLLQLDVIKKVEKAIAASMYNSPLHVDILNKIGQLESQKQINDAQLAEQERLTGHLKNGSPAPEINLPGVNGGNISLSSLKGKVVLLDFWASWCNPCRQENPNVVRMYAKYKDKGFTVYSVSLDKDKGKWTAAIQKDGLVWPNHVSDLKFWDSQAAKTYGVSSIPFTVLIDKDGKIIDKNLRGADLENKLKEIFGS